MVTGTGDSWGRMRRGVRLTAEGRRWNEEYVTWRHARLDRVQASARVWLGVLTTLLTLLGSVVLLKGGSLVTGVTANGWFQLVLIVLVGLVFAFAVLAVIAGGAATWGGLKDIAPTAETNKNVASQAEPAVNEGETKTVEMTWGWWQKPLLRVALLAASTPPAERAEALKVLEPKVRRSEPAWQKYKDDIVDNADRNRIYLHASRILGVLAAALIAVLAIVAVIAGTVSPAPSDVIVIHHGHVSCGPASRYAKDTGVTQIVPVNNC
jgi:hypothetical protein